MADTSPDAEYTKEIRFAIVMYGGVSLAIYINGIAQELLRLVRATSKAAKDKNGNPICLTGTNTNLPEQEKSKIELKGTERVYRLLKYGQEYVRQGEQAYEDAYRQRQLKSMAKKAALLGYKLVPETIST